VKKQALSTGKPRVYRCNLCYTLFISFKLDNWFCVVPLAADPVMGLMVIFLPAVPEREVQNGRQTVCRKYV
jgi:hypothetical protein